MNFFMFQVQALVPNYYSIAVDCGWGYLHISNYDELMAGREGNKFKASFIR